MPRRCWQSDELLEAHKDDWLVREIRLYWKRVLKRIDMTSRSLIALIEPGSCFAGTLAELLFAADRSVMFADARGDNRGRRLHLSPLNFGAYPMGNGLTRLATRFLGEPDSFAEARATHRRGAAGAGMRTRSAWSPSPMTSRTGTTRCG